MGWGMAWGKLPLLRSPLFWLVVACVACLGPFADKAFHIDDPLFLWTARQIQSHPLDFYGFKVTWYSTEMNMAEVTKNPPLASYYLALAALAVGWGEVGLHLAFLLPAIGVIAGTYLLAQRYCARPFQAALVTLLTPVFLVSSSNLMCDTLMLCLWVWALVLWERGLHRRDLALLAASGVLMGLAVWTKYFALSLVPLVLVYSLAVTRRPGRWLLALLVPILMATAYELWTRHLYGKGLILDAAAYSGEVKTWDKLILPLKLVIGMGFLGGCVAAGLFYLPWLLSWRMLLASILLTGLLYIALLFTEAAGPQHLMLDYTTSQSYREGLVRQLTLLAAGGIAVVVLAVADLWAHRNAVSLLLFLWVAGTLLFAVHLNWTINGRTFLPLAPAVGILLMRRLDRVPVPPRLGEWGRGLVALVPGALVGLTVTLSDYCLAGSARNAARDLAARYSTPGTTMWFEGHWGFQYYMQERGCQSLDLYRMGRCRTGDRVVLPANNTQRIFWPIDKKSRIWLVLDAPPKEAARFPRLKWEGRRLGLVQEPVFPFLMTMRQGAGFYSHLFGPLPFALKPGPDEVYEVIELLDDEIPEPAAVQPKQP